MIKSWDFILPKGAPEKTFFEHKLSEWFHWKNISQSPATHARPCPKSAEFSANIWIGSIIIKLDGFIVPYAPAIMEVEKNLSLGSGFLAIFLNIYWGGNSTNTWRNGHHFSERITISPWSQRIPIFSSFNMSPSTWLGSRTTIGKAMWSARLAIALRRRLGRAVGNC